MDKEESREALQDQQHHGCLRWHTHTLGWLVLFQRRVCLNSVLRPFQQRLKDRDEHNYCWRRRGDILLLSQEQDYENTRQILLTRYLGSL
jgi:hypothetical protein